MNRFLPSKPWLPNALLLPLTCALSFIVAACSPSETSVASAGDNAVATEEATITIATMPADPDPALWVLKDDDTTIYLFGTVHILKPGLSWFDEAVKDAFDDSDELVTEMLEPDPAEMVKVVNDLAIDKTGISLRDKLTPEDRADYEAAMAELKVPVASFDPMDPWFASVTMSLIPLMQAGYDANKGVEDDLTASAKIKGMKLVGLETPRQQLGFFDNLPEDVQIRFLNFTVDSLGEVADGMENMVAQWALGNTDALAELMNAGLDEKILYETLLVQRNANWAEWVEKRMEQPGKVFLAVGAGHLAGEGSLQAQLEKKGFVAERIEY